jgi:hypothetical protein
VQNVYKEKGGKIIEFDFSKEEDFYQMMKTLNLMCASYLVKICKIVDHFDLDQLNDNINDLLDIMTIKHPEDYSLLESLKISEEEAQ